MEIEMLIIIFLCDMMKPKKYDLVSFRMYPYGIISEIHGFSKGAILSANTLKFETVF
ncbi:MULTISPECIES: hypothetical protein [Thermoanaerobacter]|uniref:hypothetical protein n=1 Tax=Thermoanaerobacter TaxID=1754 RepID=UPI000AEB77BF|nr:hypothetical protein [Thermoanaerobacter sp. YS13]